MYKQEVIFGLRDLLQERHSNMKSGNIILVNAIRLIQYRGCNLEEIGCPECGKTEFISCGRKDKYYETYQCKNCNSRITVKVFEEIVEVKPE